MNHSWRRLCQACGIELKRFFVWRVFGGMLTFTACVLAWVWFRAVDFNSAVRLYTALCEVDQLILSDQLFFLFPWLEEIVSIVWVNHSTGHFLSGGLIWIVIGLFIVFVMPNVQTFFSFETRDPKQYAVSANGMPTKSTLRYFLVFQPQWCWSVLLSLVVATTILMMQTIQETEFLYFDF